VDTTNTETEQPDEWHRRMVIPLLKLGVTMLESRSTSSVSREDVVRQMLFFVAEHADKYFRNVLSKFPLQHANRLSETTLEEFSLVTSLLRQLAHPDIAVLAVEVLGREKNEKLQRLMLSLLCGFADRDAIKNKTKVSVDGHLQDKDNAHRFVPAYPATSRIAEDTTKNQAEAIDRHLQEITANLLGYVRATMVAPSPDEPGVFFRHAPHCRILLKPKYRVGQVHMRTFTQEEPPVGILMPMIQHAKKCYVSSRESYMRHFDGENQPSDAMVAAADAPSMSTPLNLPIITPMVRRIVDLVEEEKKALNKYQADAHAKPAF